MESKPTKVILCSRSIIKVQALKAVIRDIGEMDIYAKSNCKNAKTIPQPLGSGKICAKKRIEKVEQLFRLSMRKKNFFWNLDSLERIHFNKKPP